MTKYTWRAKSAMATLLMVGTALLFTGCPTSDDIKLDDDLGLGQWDILVDTGSTVDSSGPPLLDATDTGTPPELPPSGCTIDSQCAGQIADLQPCEKEACEAATGDCVAVPADDGASCDDNNACTVTSCKNGTCFINSQVTCDDGNLCTGDHCDETTGCQYIPSVEACDDGDPCTADDQCDGGVCKGGQNTCSCTGQPDGSTCSDGNPGTVSDFCLNQSCNGITLNGFKPTGSSSQTGFTRLDNTTSTVLVVGSDVRAGNVFTWAAAIEGDKAIYHQQSERNDTVYLDIGGGVAAGTNGKVSRWEGGQTWSTIGPLQSSVDGVISSLTFANINAVWSDGSVALLFGRNKDNYSMKITRCDDAFGGSPACKTVGLANASGGPAGGGGGYFPRAAAGQVTGGSIQGPYILINTEKSPFKNVIVKHPGASSDTMTEAADFSGVLGMEWHNVTVSDDGEVWAVGSKGLLARGQGNSFSSLGAIPNTTLDAVAVTDTHVMVFGRPDNTPQLTRLWVHKRGDSPSDPANWKSLEVALSAAKVTDAVVHGNTLIFVTAPTAENPAGSGAIVGTVPLQ